ncbi:hypothetical protein FIBSPDRAFT_263950 [Athelia psychrophila]|uniref:Mid2 domain-containing protein n=1 Tax=Athelia psychrophila TaxID=1759441 RepID=A0A165X9Y5_9AGAM|nr:hypothetical protein FIBSPDRAFT_263950 [Fibularhizoctonia sp. CBS 109695]
MSLGCLLAIVAAIPSILLGVTAQHSEAVCLDQFDWMFNSYKQTPCLMAAFALNQCTSNNYDVPALPLNSYYDPMLIDATTCACTSVTYSLLAACGACQNNIWADWNTWKTNCTQSVENSLYPYNVPNGTEFPGWAYLDVTATGNTFNVAAASADRFAPISTQTSASTSSTSTMTYLAAVTASPAASAGYTSSPTTSAAKKPNMGAIAGGVICGLLGLGALAGLVIFFLLRRRRNQAAPTRQESFYPSEIGLYAPIYPGTGVASRPVSVDSQPRLQQPFRPYDPSDPSTYPQQAMTPSDVSTTNVPQMAQSRRSSGYLGHPEV